MECQDVPGGSKAGICWNVFLSCGFHVDFTLCCVFFVSQKHLTV